MYHARENSWRHKDQCCPLEDWQIPDPDLGLSITESFTRPATLHFIALDRGPSYSVLSSIITCCRREVSDSRDRVYGLLGLGTGIYTQLVKPDYAISAEEKCKSVVISSVERTGTLELLSHLFEHQDPRLPSFISNWTGVFSWSENYANRLSRLNLFNAAHDTVARLEFVLSEMVAIKGTVFNVITAVCSHSALPHDSEAEYLKELCQLAGIMSRIKVLMAKRMTPD